MGSVAYWQDSPGCGRAGPCSLLNTDTAIPAFRVAPSPAQNVGLLHPFICSGIPPDPPRPVSLHCWDSLVDGTGWSNPFKKPQIRLFFQSIYKSPVETLGQLCPCSHHQVPSGCVSGIPSSALLQLPQLDKEVCRHLLCRAGNYKLVKSMPLKAGKASVPIKNKIADIFIN